MSVTASRNNVQRRGTHIWTKEELLSGIKQPKKKSDKTQQSWNFLAEINNIQLQHSSCAMDFQVHKRNFPSFSFLVGRPSRAGWVCVQEAGKDRQNITSGKLALTQWNFHFWQNTFNFDLWTPFNIYCWNALQQDIFCLLTDVYAVGCSKLFAIVESIWVKPKKFRHNGGVKRQNSLHKKSWQFWSSFLLYLASPSSFHITKILSTNHMLTIKTSRSCIYIFHVCLLHVLSTLCHRFFQCLVVNKICICSTCNCHKLSAFIYWGGNLSECPFSFPWNFMDPGDQLISSACKSCF